MKNKTDNLLARYFGGNASEQDMQVLEQWISTSSDNQVYFDQLTNLYAKLGGTDSNTPKPNTDRAKKLFMAYMSKQNNNQRKIVLDTAHKPIFKRWMVQAASVALIFTLSFSAWLIYTSEQDVVLATGMNLKQEILPDQTQIELSRNSKITYSSNYGKKSRNIRLEGKASFIVGHKGKGTLLISANETFIEDIGTVFSISAYPDSVEVTVNVREGKVHFFTNKNKGIIISANETGIYNKQTKDFTVLKSRNDTTQVNIIHIEFNGVILSEAIKTLNKQYGIVIKFEEPDIGERKITVNFDGENVDMILRIIAETLDLNVKKVNDGYLLSNNKKLHKL
ncbi:MAG: FecR domain-containing protein [Paludibacter sp.]|nr:FecR domain-containing protein [Paludibacter sp.]